MIVYPWQQVHLAVSGSYRLKYYIYLESSRNIFPLYRLRTLVKFNKIPNHSSRISIRIIIISGEPQVVQTILTPAVRHGKYIETETADMIKSTLARYETNNV